jgi:hypothetical protein
MSDQRPHCRYSGQTVFLRDSSAYFMRGDFSTCRNLPSSLPLGAAKYSWCVAGAMAYGCFPGGRKRPRETETECFRREIEEELPRLRFGRVRLWKEVKAKNKRSGRKMSDAIFIAEKAKGPWSSETRMKSTAPSGASPGAFG